MTGWNWDGSEMNWKRKPEHYGAIHFHDDDLYDCKLEDRLFHPPAEGPEERDLLHPPAAGRPGGVHAAVRARAEGQADLVARLPGADRELPRLCQPPDGHQLELRRIELVALHRDQPHRPVPGRDLFARPLDLRPAQRRQRRQPVLAPAAHPQHAAEGRSVAVQRRYPHHRLAGRQGHQLRHHHRRGPGSRRARLPEALSLHRDRHASRSTTA